MERPHSDEYRQELPEKNQEQRLSTDLYKNQNDIRTMADTIRTYLKSKELCDRAIADPKIPTKEKEPYFKEREEIIANISKARKALAERINAQDEVENEIIGKKIAEDMFNEALDETLKKMGVTLTERTDPDEIVWFDKPKEKKKELPS